MLSPTPTPRPKTSRARLRWSVRNDICIIAVIMKVASGFFCFVLLFATCGFAISFGVASRLDTKDSKFHHHPLLFHPTPQPPAPRLRPPLPRVRWLGMMRMRTRTVTVSWVATRARAAEASLFREEARVVKLLVTSRQPPI